MEPSQYRYDGNGTRVAKGRIANMTSCDVIHNGFAETNLYAPGPNGKQLEESDGNFNPLHFNFFLNGRAGAAAAAIFSGPEEFVGAEAGFEGGMSLLHIAPIGVPGFGMLVYGGVRIYQNCF